MRPDLRQLTVLKEEKGGYSKKYRVRDASGREWVAKIGKEAQSETACCAIAVGTWLCDRSQLPRSQVTLPGKELFKMCDLRRVLTVETTGSMEMESYPFTGTPELQGLKIMMALMNNWDL
jgi:hypothetical protein